MPPRKKSKFEQWFSFSRHQRRFGADKIYESLEQTDIETLKKKLIVGNDIEYTYGSEKDLNKHIENLKRQKRHDILIKAYAKANVQEKLVLVGTGELLEASKKLVKDLGIEDKVIFTGFKKNPYPYMKHAKLMVLSSDFEGLGLVILEALALGTPVISTDCPSGPNEILANQYLVAVQDVDELASRIRLFVEKDTEVSYLNQKFTQLVATKAYLDLCK